MGVPWWPLSGVDGCVIETPFPGAAAALVVGIAVLATVIPACRAARRSGACPLAGVAGTEPF
jgi:hypothetical protein